MTLADCIPGIGYGILNPSPFVHVQGTELKLRRLRECWVQELLNKDSFLSRAAIELLDLEIDSHLMRDDL